MIHHSVITDFCTKEYRPEVEPSAFIHPLAAVIGHVRLGRRVFVAPFASVRADEGHPISVGDESNVQDGVVIHALETEHHGEPVSANLVEIDGEPYAVHVGRRVSLAHQVQVHGPAAVGDDTFVGMKSLVFRAKIGQGCVVEPGAILMGVNVGDGRVVPAGTVLRSQSDADDLPWIDADYPLKDINQGVVRVNTGLAEAYKRAGIATRGC